MSALIARNEAGVLVCLTPIVITCGCGSVVPNARRDIKNAGVPNVPMVSSSNNPTVKEYIHQQGLDDLVPSLRKSKHAVIYNPQTGYFVDMLKAPLVQEYYDNVRIVVTG